MGKYWRIVPLAQGCFRVYYVPRIVLIDNQDSFSHLLADAIFRAVGIPPQVVAHDGELPANADVFVLSPGPGRPEDARLSIEAVRSGVPCVGVCLGHQVIAMEAGATVGPAQFPMHGRVSQVSHCGTGMFAGLPQPMEVVRYHSLEITDFNDAALEVLARADDGSIMACRRMDAPQWGVQFHPESIATEQGVDLVRNALLCALEPWKWAQRYPYFAWFEFDGYTRIAAGNERWEGPLDTDVALYGALSYEATGGVDGSSAAQLHTRDNSGADSAQSIWFHPEHELHWEGVVPEELLGDVPPAPQASVISFRDSREDYREAISRCRQAIARGDSYELCLTTAASSILLEDVSALELYVRLRSLVPAPMRGMLTSPEVSIISASPERFIRVRPEQPTAAGGRTISAHPIKGTRPAGSDPAELLSSEKDRAENLMIVDLMRNDLARVCTPGSVTVEELFGIYELPQVTQMISTISGHVRPEISAIDATLAAFPGGSMTGAPKQKTMDLLREYEGHPRGYYSGVMGYIDCDDIDLSMLIRCVVLRQRRLHYGVGGAITWLSDPDDEYDEVLVKARPLFALLGQQYVP